MNRKGQFSIIAALLVAVILVSAVITTYSSIRYSSGSDIPHTLSTVDEVNLALKRILGFTVGYYGSVLQVTGNTTYAKALASNYLSSGLDNIADIRPDLSPSFKVVDLDLRTNWYSNSSYSSGNFTIEYDLGGLGVSGLTYSTSSQLEVQVLTSSNVNQALLNITGDGEPLVDLGKSSFKFYKYVFSNSSWDLVGLVNEPITYMDGRYLVDLPTQLDSSFIIQVEDTRGLLVVASSFSQFTGTLAWNTTSVEEGFDFVDNSLSDVDSLPNIGTHTDFNQQQAPPDVAYDVLREDVSGAVSTSSYPFAHSLLGGTSVTSGDLSDLQSADYSDMTFHSYVSASSTTAKTNAFIIYRSSTGSSSVPNERTWTGETASWGSESNLPTSGSNVRFTRTAYCPIESRSYEKVVVTLSDDGNLDAYVWNGISWTATNNIGSVGTTANLYESFDVVYEKTSGEILLVYAVSSLDSDRDLAYRTWSIDLGWSTEKYLDDTSHSSNIQYYWVELAANPVSGSNEVTLVGLDGSSYDANGWVWDGVSWGNIRELENNVATDSRGCIAVEYETQSGRAWTAVGSSSTSSTYSMRSQTGGTWASSKTNPGIGSTPYWCTLKADPSSNRLMLTSIDSSRDLNTIYWSGSGSWVVLEHDTSVDSSSQRCADFAWELTGGKGLLVWGTTSGQIAYRTFTAPSSWGSSQSKVMNSNHYWVQLRTNPRSISGDVKILGAILDGNNDIGIIKWVGSDFTVIGSSTVTSSGNNAYESFDLAFMNYGSATENTCEFEFTGVSNLQDWLGLTWSVDASASVSDVSLTMALYNYSASTYSGSSDGYNLTTIGTSNVTITQLIPANPTYFRDNDGNWKLHILAAKSTATPFDISLDIVRYEPQSVNYVLSLEEQWTDVSSTRQDLCIKTGSFSSTESLIVQVWNNSSWQFLMTLAPNIFNNASVASYIGNGSILTIRLTGSYETMDSSQDSWNISSVFLKPQPDIDYLINLQDSTFTIEYLQNGTLRWLGQNLELATQALPIPPIPVKAIHVNQTFVNGTNKEVSFQIEDWASDYQIPLGLTSNATVFSNRQMIVFLVNNQVVDFTVWWDGSDKATQTQLAFNNIYFQDNIEKGILSNGNLKMLFSSLDLYVNSFDSTATSWTENGISPYLNENTNYYINHNIDNGREGWFSFDDLPTEYAQLFASPNQGLGASISINFECTRQSDNDYFEFRINDGNTTYGPFRIDPPNNSVYGWSSYDITAIIDTLSKLNNAEIDITYRQSGSSASNIYIRQCRLSLNFWVTSIYGNSTAKVDLMEINNEESVYGAGLAYVIQNGIVRDIIQQEAEWNGGAENCPNIYANIVLTLPAGVSYYTYQLRYMFIESSQVRTITDICPIRLTTSFTPTQAQTENGTLAGFPIIQNGTDIFYNYSGGSWTSHHWSQLITDNGQGAGIMFSDSNNQKLYYFDAMAGNPTGVLSTNLDSKIIELKPVNLTQVIPFKSALDITWNGAVATFDNTTPICEMYESTTPSGLWILAEYPPTLTIVAQTS